MKQHKPIWGVALAFLIVATPALAQEVKMADDVAMTVQDRAYTSPIWYTP